MIPTYYDVEKLMRIIYNQKLDRAKSVMQDAKRNDPAGELPSGRMACRACPSGAAK